MNYCKFKDLDVGMSFEFKEVVTEEKDGTIFKIK